MKTETKTKAIRLLVMDDSPDDAHLAAAIVRRGYSLRSNLRVDNPADFQAAIEKNDWDIVVCEFQLPKIGAAAVLKALDAAKRNIPVIVFTKTIGDAELLQIMRAGARDVVMKNQASRLLPAIERELV